MAQAVSYAKWDELIEGAEREITMGPLTRTDFVRFAGANGDFALRALGEFVPFRVGNRLGHSLTLLISILWAARLSR